MNKEKQIEEMALDVWQTGGIDLEIAGAIAIDLYEQGYRKERQGEWISVEERLPTKDEYLTHHNDGLDTLKRITVAYMTDTVEYDIGCYDGYKWLNQFCTRVIKDVIAWKPFETYTPK